MNNRCVFVNCPYDKRYLPLLRKVIFVLSLLGFEVKLALDDSNTTTPRMEKIERLIKGCKYSIHDISYMKAAKKNEFYRMNMPFELGMDYGFNRFVDNDKKTLILEGEKYNYHKALSDLSGMDIECHNNNDFEIIVCIRTWASTINPNKLITGQTAFWNLYFDFMKFLSDEANSLELKEEDVLGSIPDYKIILKRFISEIAPQEREKYCIFS